MKQGTVTTVCMCVRVHVCVCVLFYILKVRKKERRFLGLT